MDLQTPAKINEEPEIAYDKLFRSALRGFHRDDVLSYLERLARTRQKESERYATHIRHLEATIESLKKEQAEPHSDTNGVAASENEALRSENDVLRLQAQALTAEVATLMSTVQTLQEAAAATPAVPQPDELPRVTYAPDLSACPSQPAEPAASSAELTALHDRCAVLEDKLRRYEREKARFDEIEENAYRNARRIEEDAQDKTSQLRDDVALRIQELSALLDATSHGIDTVVQEVYAELSQCGTRYAALRKTTEDLRSKLQDIRL